MESEQHHYELRSSGSRSRSHTPMIPSRLLPEVEEQHHYDLRSKSRERSHTPGEVTNSRPGSRSLTGSSSKTHEKNMETIRESKEGSFTESLTDNQSTKSDGSTTRKAERRSERQRAKRQIFANGESKEDTLDQKAERKRKSVTPRRILTSDYSSEEGEKHPSSRPRSAYEIYKQAGDWWNVFPKTDYTYSKASQCRYEIAPGILAMPNMSRRSIHADGDNVVSQVGHQTLSLTSGRTTESGFSDGTEMGSLIHSSTEDNHDTQSHTSDSAIRSIVYRKTLKQYTNHKEIIYSDSRNLYPRQRFLSSTSSKYTDMHGTFDSDTEVDELDAFAASTFKAKQDQKWRIVQWFTYFTTLIAAWYRKTVEFFKFRMFRRKQYYTPQVYHESKWRTLRKFLDRCSHIVYFFYVRILVFDAWLLSRFAGVRKWIQDRGPKVMWITLLPLFLLFGCCLAYYLSLPLVEIALEPAAEELSPNIQWKDLVSRNIKDDRLISNLVNRIGALENEQTNQMEYLMNVLQTLDEYKRSDANFQKEYNDKITEVIQVKKIDTTELRGVMYNELKVIRHEFEKLHELNKIDTTELRGEMYNELKVIRDEFEKLRELYSELKSCCNANAESVANQDIDKQVENILLGYFPSGTTREDLTRIIRDSLASHGKENQISSTSSNTEVQVSDEHVRKIVKEILRIYDADKTGQVDYALESAGGQIISTRCTQRYDIKSRAVSLFGYPLYYESNNPRTVIQGNPMQPGVCWAFQDFPGYLLIQLRSLIYVTGFTLEHVSILILPNENMSSAPRKFNVWGLTEENDPDPVMFGDYEFKSSDDNLQYFPVQNTKINRPYQYVELRIHSNHGQLEYTCLYRFRVHGRVT